MQACTSWCILSYLCVSIFHQTWGQIFDHDAETPIVTVAEGDTVILPCSSDVTGNHAVIWIGPYFKLLAINDMLTQDENRISIIRESPNDWNLQLEKVAFADQGIYQCRINKQPALVKPVILAVQVPPRVEDTSDISVSVYETTSWTLECRSTGVPPPIVTWYKLSEDEEYDEQTREEIETDSEQYTIYNMSMDDAGLYECEASNEVVAGSGTTMLYNRKQFSVRYKAYPKFVVPKAENVRVLSGQPAVLPCAIQYLDEFKVVWYRGSDNITDGRDFVSDDRYSIKHWSPLDWRLRIDSVGLRDAGEYACTINTIPEKRKTVYLKVEL